MNKFGWSFGSDLLYSRINIQQISHCAGLTHISTDLCKVIHTLPVQCGPCIVRKNKYICKRNMRARVLCFSYVQNNRYELHRAAHSEIAPISYEEITK